MDNQIKKEILYDVTQAIRILETKEAKDTEELKTLSDHSIDDIAVHKDLELVSIAVLLYSIYKITSTVSEDDYKGILQELRFARNNLEQGNLSRYNRSIKNLFDLVKKSNAKVKEHLADVMHAARIKKGTALLQHGLSIGQAAGIMGLSNWDLQHYAGKSTALDQHTEKIPARNRMRSALQLFGVKNGR